MLAALLEIEAQLGAGLERGLEHEVAHARLAWWREECARLSAGHRTASADPAAAAHFGERAHGALAALSGLVDTATWDLAAATFETRRELDAYCERWSAALVEPLAAAALPAAAPGLALRLGQALRELELLNGLTTDARHGRIRLPLEELASAARRPRNSPGPLRAAALRATARRHREARGVLAARSTALPREQTGAARAPGVGRDRDAAIARAWWLPCLVPRARVTITRRWMAGARGVPPGVRTRAGCCCPTA